VSTKAGQLHIATPAVVLTGTVFSAISSGDLHTCGLAATGAAHCWGAHAIGAPGSVQRTPYPWPVAGNRLYASLASGLSHTCASTMEGSVYCWGRESPFGDLQGPVSWETPRLLETEVRLGSLIAGSGFSCGLQAGAAICWGRNDWGQLGSGSASSRADIAAVAGDLSFVSLGEGAGHTVCGITVEQGLHCWGRGDAGQLGAPAPATCLSGPCSPGPLQVLPELRFRAVAAGPHHTCALTVAGEAFCWGLNGDVNRLGSNTLEPGAGVVSEQPVRVTTDERFSDISVGADHACALAFDGVAHCWGSNRRGQLGGGLGVEWWYATAVQGGPIGVSFIFRSVSAGNQYTCGITPSGRAYCWGRTGEHLGQGFTG
jgi:alpha-tubulin suppressor-like RCC1 family protein